MRTTENVDAYDIVESRHVTFDKNKFLGAPELEVPTDNF